MNSFAFIHACLCLKKNKWDLHCYSDQLSCVQACAQITHLSQFTVGHFPLQPKRKWYENDNLIAKDIFRRYTDLSKKKRFHFRCKINFKIYFLARLYFRDKAGLFSSQVFFFFFFLFSIFLISFLKKGLQLRHVLTYKKKEKRKKDKMKLKKKKKKKKKIQQLKQIFSVFLCVFALLGPRPFSKMGLSHI